MSLDSHPLHPFTFPAALKWIGKTREEYHLKLVEEVDEVSTAQTPWDRVMELFDVCHVCETEIRTICEAEGINPVEVAAAVGVKNAVRGYYKPQG